MIVIDDSIMTLQAVASPMIVILMTLEVSFMLLANIYSRGVTHDDRHVRIGIYLLYRPQSILEALGSSERRWLLRKPVGLPAIEPHR